MPWIKVIDESETEDPISKVYQSFREKGRFRESPEGKACFQTPYALFTTNGKAFQDYVEWSDTVRFGKSDLSRAQREMVATITSVTNHCVF